jgi:hypothetical protein
VRRRAPAPAAAPAAAGPPRCAGPPQPATPPAAAAAAPTRPPGWSPWRGGW